MKIACHSFLSWFNAAPPAGLLLLLDADLVCGGVEAQLAAVAFDCHPGQEGDEGLLLKLGVGDLGLVNNELADLVPVVVDDQVVACLVQRPLGIDGLAFDEKLAADKEAEGHARPDVLSASPDELDPLLLQRKY